MMKRFDIRILFGLVLIVSGTLFLLESLNIFQGGLQLLWTVLFGSIGIAFLYIYANNRDNWWALIPGFSIMGISLSIGTEMIVPSIGEIIGGGIVLGGIALSFWTIYFTKRESFWWAIIPAGVLSTLAVIAVLDTLFPGKTDGIFLLGLGATFIFIARLPGYGDSLKWAYIPGGIVIAIGILTVSFMQQVINLLWPLVLIIGGGYVLYKNLKN